MIKHPHRAAGLNQLGPTRWAGLKKPFVAVLSRNKHLRQAWKLSKVNPYVSEREEAGRVQSVLRMVARPNRRRKKIPSLPKLKCLEEPPIEA